MSTRRTVGRAGGDPEPGQVGSEVARAAPGRVDDGEVGGDDPARAELPPKPRRGRADRAWAADPEDVLDTPEGRPARPHVAPARVDARGSVAGRGQVSDLV